MYVREETVTTKYVGPTDTRGSRIVSSYLGHTMTIPFPYEASNAHRHAADMIVSRYGAEGAHVLYLGETRNGNGKRFVVWTGEGE